VRRADEVYPKIGKLGAMARRGIEEVFGSHGFNVRCTGPGEALGVESSLVGVNFLKADIDRIDSPEKVWNPEISDVELREKVLKLAMIQEGFNIFHGYGSISFAHTAREIQASLDAVERIAKKWKKHKPPRS
jgi:glutamate-1-semialdehyde 2,1-aminomutase